MLPIPVFHVPATLTAHQMQASGPYGYSPAAELFDKACGKWASTGEGHYLLEEARSFVPKAQAQPPATPVRTLAVLPLGSIVVPLSLLG